jgi:hypothetical protein
MLKKLIAKLRRTLGPSSDAKPAKEAAKPSLPASQHPARTVHAESTRKRESRPKTGDRAERAPREGSSHGSQEGRSRGPSRHSSSGSPGPERGRGRDRERSRPYENDGP